MQKKTSSDGMHVLVRGHRCRRVQVPAQNLNVYPCVDTFCLSLANSLECYAQLNVLESLGFCMLLNDMMRQNGSIMVQ